MAVGKHTVDATPFVAVLLFQLNECLGVGSATGVQPYLFPSAYYAIVLNRQSVQKVLGFVAQCIVASVLAVGV